MTADRYQLTNIWKRTLAPQRKDDHTASRERLRSAFVNFRGRAERLGGEIPRDLPFFTVHDVSHLDALWEMVDLIAGPDYPINPIEAFILGGAILVHDLAMSQAAFANELDQLKTESLWNDTVASCLRSKLNRPPTRVEMDRPDKETEQLVVQSLLRNLHARQANVLPMKEWGYAGTRYYLLDDADIRNAFGHDIGKVAYSHHWPLDHLLDREKLPQTQSGGPGWLPREWTVDLVKLAILLRTADAAHADDLRAPGFLAALRQPAGVSDHHWRFQSLLRSPHRDEQDDRIRYRSNRPFTGEEIDAWWVAYDWLTMVDRELRSVDSLLAATGRPRLAAKGVWNTEHPARLAEDLRTEGWEPADVQLRVSDIASLVRMLGGTRLYGNRPEVPLRELIQNAADAIRARRLLENRDSYIGRIVVRPGRDSTSNQDWIELEDNGVGMSKTVLTDTLLDFGATFWGTARMRGEFPGLEAAGMEATGEFGIGFFSVFMWGDRVQVTTRRYCCGFDDTWVLEFRRGVALRPTLRRGTHEEQHSLPEGGTRVRVWCDPKRRIPAVILQRERHSPSTSSCTWREMCEWLAPALDVDLYVEQKESLQLTVRANDWLSIDAETLLLRLNRKSDENAMAAIRRQSTELALVTSYLGVVRDERGQPVARGTVWLPHYHWFHNCSAVCGGLRMDGGGNFLGIYFANPETAARHSPVRRENISGWITWAKEQMQFDDASRFHKVVRAQAAMRLCPFIHPGNMPIGRSHAGWVTLEEFVASIPSVAGFRCVSGPLEAASHLLMKSPNTLTLVVSGQDVLNQLDGRGFTIIRLLKDAAKEQWGCDCEVSDVNEGHRTTYINGTPLIYTMVTLSRRSG